MLTKCFSKTLQCNTRVLQSSTPMKTMMMTTLRTMMTMVVLKMVMIAAPPKAMMITALLSSDYACRQTNSNNSKWLHNRMWTFFWVYWLVGTKMILGWSFAKCNIALWTVCSICLVYVLLSYWHVGWYTVAIYLSLIFAKWTCNEPMDIGCVI